MFGPETIERFLHSSYDQFAAYSTVPDFLPLPAERFARQRLTALARVEGHAHDGKPTVLFLCVHNAGRSQMVLGFFQHLAGNRAVAWSGGSEPGHELEPAVVATMAGRGVRRARIRITSRRLAWCPVTSASERPPGSRGFLMAALPGGRQARIRCSTTAISEGSRPRTRVRHV
ncbi:three-helix bundle dimerization domain-containing protein [Saccharothrix longispora]|uniref:three-helix bundle dimerization domain-containing protein n=1 Tax=Saccharothrix longispora TaxID=33920 RepID=UPI0031E962E8